MWICYQHWCMGGWVTRDRQRQRQANAQVCQYFSNARRERERERESEKDRERDRERSARAREKEQERERGKERERDTWKTYKQRHACLHTCTRTYLRNWDPRVIDWHLHAKCAWVLCMSHVTYETGILHMNIWIHHEHEWVMSHIVHHVYESFYMTQFLCEITHFICEMPHFLDMTHFLCDITHFLCDVTHFICDMTRFICPWLIICHI